MKKNYTHLLVLGCVLLWACSAFGQDIHYSQFYNSQLNLNPGLTGVFNGDVRFSGHFKQQWKSVPVNYLTFTGAYDQKFFPKNSDKEFWGFGIMFNYDRGGYSKLQLLQLALSGSYSRILSPSAVLTFGVQAGAGQRAFKQDDLTWNDQWNGSQHDPTLPSGENFDQTSKFYPDLGAGLNLRLQAKDNRTKVDIGGGLFHINKPKQSFYDANSVRIPMRISGHALGSVKVADPLDVVLNVGAQFQGDYQETVLGAGLKLYINRQRGREFALQLGANYRANNAFITDALVPALEFFFNTWHIGLSYDVNLSQFDTATEKNGGPEVYVSYRIINVKPLEDSKACPIY